MNESHPEGRNDAEAPQCGRGGRNGRDGDGASPALAVDQCFDLGADVYVAKAFGSTPTKGTYKTARGFTSDFPGAANFNATICAATDGTHLRGTFVTTIASNGGVIFD